jgi:hypothetical protein
MLQQPRTRRRAHASTNAASRTGNAWARRASARLCPPYESILYSLSLLAIRLSNSFFPIRYSLLTIRYFHSPPPTRGGRSAGGARMHARHPSRHAMTGMQTPLSMRKPGAKPALRSLRTTGGPGVRSICANRASPACMRRLAFPATGRSPFGAPRGISGPGPCSPLSGIPSRIVRQPHMPHGSSLPGGAGLANLPGAAANRLQGHHSLARLTGSPLEAPLMSEDAGYIA